MRKVVSDFWCACSVTFNLQLLEGVFWLFAAVLDNERLTAEEMDERRRQNVAYEYLCHLEEAKR